MINELYTLWQSLQKCGIQLGEPHQNVKTPGKAEGLIIGIDGKGIPQTVEYVSAENMAKLWTLRKGQHNSFPYIKFKKTILEIKPDDSIYNDFKKAKFEEKKNILVQRVKNNNCNNQDLSLVKWTLNQIAEVKGKDKKLSALEELVNRFPKDKKDSLDFFNNLIDLLLKNLNEQTIDVVKTILVGYIKKGKIVCDASLFFDISDWEKYLPLPRIACPEMGLMLSKYLPKIGISSKKTGRSAFGGSNLHLESFPDPNLPVVGRVYLFSMNEDAPCHSRYGKIGSTIFPASPDEVQSMHGAIKWCVDEVRKGKTWQGIPNNKHKKDLVIAYLEEKPETEIELASAFTSFDVSEEETVETIYEQKTMMVCNALKGIDGLRNDSKINILVITKVDEGRAQAVLNAVYTIENITKSIKQWHIAANNRPHFSIFIPGKKDEKEKVMEPFCPSPSEVMKCLQNQWIRNGFDRSDVSGVGLQCVYDLFLGKECVSQEMANMFLDITLQRLGPLFLGIAGADHYGNVTKYLVEARKTILTGISILAISLYKLGIRKEDYMKNAAFNVGRLLAFADGLHAQYCKLQMKRKDKDLPPQLIGNAYLPVAFENPNKAIALLGDRLRIYYAWATKVQGEEYKLVKWMMFEMGKIAADLENISWPVMTDDAVKAQVLLGYLARTKSE